MSQWLPVCVALAGDPSPIASIHSSQLTVVISFLPPWDLFLGLDYSIQVHGYSLANVTT